VEIWPFNFAEALRHDGTPPPSSLPGAAERSRLEARYRTYLRAGGFPAIQGQPDHERIQTLQDYVELVVVRDIVERHGIGNVLAARTFILGLLQLSGKTCSVNKLYNDFKSRGIDVAKDTLHALLGHAQDAFLTFAVSRFQPSARKRAQFPRKLYAVDPGLAAAVSHAAARDIGARLETAVYLELRRRLGRAREGAISWYQTEKGHEVDFVIGDADAGEAAELVQVSADATDPATRARELRALDEAMAELGLVTATLVTLEESSRLTVQSGTVSVVPAWRWALGL
jgi:predicted AAA+ superfamily ATPase